MKPFIGILMLILCISQFKDKNQVYISNEVTGHFVEFLIMYEDSVIIESYSLQLKLLNPIKRNLTKYLITKRGKDTITVGDTSVIKYSNESLIFENKIYQKDIFIKKFGDFAVLDDSFSTLTNSQKLNVCRNCYFLLKPSKYFSERMNKYHKKGLRLKEDVNIRLPFNKFIDELKMILPES